MPYDPGADLAAGGNYVNSLNDQQRKTAAYNALNSTYGPAIAYDPVNAANAAKANVETQTQDLQVQQAQRQAAAEQNLVQQNGPNAGDPTAAAAVQNNNANLNENQRGSLVRDLSTLSSLGVKNPDGSFDGKSVSSVLGTDPAKYGMSPQQFALIQQRASQPGASDALQQLIGAQRQTAQPNTVTGSLTAYTDPKTGQTVGVQSTKNGTLNETLLGDLKTAPQQQVPIAAENAAAHTVQANAAALTASQPTQTITDATGNVYTLSRKAGAGGVTPSPTNIQSISGPAGTAAKAGATVEGKATGQQAVNTSPYEQNIARATMGQADLQIGRIQTSLSDALSKVGVTTTGLLGEASGAMRTGARTGLEADVQVAKSNAAVLAATLARQANGGKGNPVAVRNLQEFKAYQDALGDIDPNDAASTVRAQIQAAQSRLGALHDNMRTTYSATYGPGVLQQPGQKQPPTVIAPGARLSGGFTVVGVKQQ